MKVFISFLIFFSFSVNLNATEGTFTKDAIELLISGHDFTELSQGLSEDFRKNPITGNYKETISTNALGSEVKVNGLEYSLHINNIELKTERNKLVAAVDIDSYRFLLKKVAINHAWSSSCNNIEIRSDKGILTAKFLLDAEIIDRKINIQSEQSSLPLNKNNFHISRPEKCRAIWGANWIIERIIPKLTYYFRSHISKIAREAMVGYLSAKASEASDDFLNMSVTLPLNRPPLPSIYYSVELIPQSLTISDDAISFRSSTIVDLITFDSIDDSPLLFPEDSLSVPKRLRSYIGIHKGLFGSVLTELEKDDIFHFPIKGNYIEEIKPYLNYKFVSELLNLSDGTLGASDKIEFKMSGLLSHTTDTIKTIESAGVKSTLQGLKSIIEVNGTPKYLLEVDIDLTLSATTSVDSRKLKLNLEKPDAHLVAVTDMVKNSPVEVEEELAEEMFATIFSSLSRNEAISFTLPRFEIGTKSLHLFNTDIDEDYIKVKVYVGKTKP